MKSFKRKFIANISYRAGFVVISKLISLLIVPIIARYFGPETYGLYNYIFTIISYCTIAVNFGFLTYGTRSISQNNDINVLNDIVTTRLLTGVISCIIVFLISLFTVFLRPYLLIILLIIIAESLFIDFYYYGKKNILFPSIAHIISQIFYVISALILVYFKSDIKYFILFYAFSRVLESSVLLIPYIRKKSLIIKFNFKNQFITLKRLLPLGFGNKITFFKGSIPTLIIPHLLSYEVLGYYSGFMKFSLVFNAAIQIILFPLGPFIVQNKDNPNIKRYIRYFLLALLFAGIFVSAVAILFQKKLIYLLLGETFAEISSFFNLGVLTILLINPLNLGSIVLINYLGQDKSFFKGSLITLILSLVLIPLLTYYMGINGAFYGNFISTVYFIAYLLMILRKNKFL